MKRFFMMVFFSDRTLSEIPVVNIMNATTFLEVIQRNSTEDWCLIVNFNAPHCPFSARLAPHFNALPRAFPALYVSAVDATEYSKLNNRYGIAGTPTVLLWQNGKAVARYMDSEYSLKVRRKNKKNQEMSGISKIFRKKGGFPEMSGKNIY